MLVGIYGARFAWQGLGKLERVIGLHTVVHGRSQTLGDQQHKKREKKSSVYVVVVYVHMCIHEAKLYDRLQLRQRRVAG